MKPRVRALKLVIFALLSLVLMVMIFRFSSQTATESTESSDAVSELINGIIEPIGAEAAEGFVRKLAHFTEFALLGASVYGFFRQCITERRVLFSVGFCALYAVSDEVHQLFVSGRACRVLDVVIDTCGSFFGIALYGLALFIILKVNGGKK